MPFSDLLCWATQRQVLETKTFTEQLQALGDIKRLDEALGVVQLTLTMNAEVWPLVRGFTKVRIAKTKAWDEVPALNIWFLIEDKPASVLLLCVERVPEY